MCQYIDDAYCLYIYIYISLSISFVLLQSALSAEILLQRYTFFAIYLRKRKKKLCTEKIFILLTEYLPRGGFRVANLYSLHIYNIYPDNPNPM